jgi:ABC-type uncharacterized transport system substrate-binding protein
LDTADAEIIVTDSLTLEQYHGICYYHLSRIRTIAVSADVAVNFGAVIACSLDDQVQDWVEIASVPDVQVSIFPWYGAEGEVTKDGWTR